ncbi:MAG TPA: protein-disulfide reductase DsbD N-terminal domain-containing protein [Roseimicrobium sp.]|nr:protein-disulfide reductase DsbD N-terminal domain-containing protein [Roseimicrobium sp.]
MKTNLLRTTLGIALLSAMLLPASAQKKPGEAATIELVTIQGDVKPGATVTAVIKVALDKGYHTHSNKPSEPQFIATKLTLTAPAGIKAGEIKYPAGKSLAVTGLAKPLSVYEDHFELSVPLTIDASATLPASVAGVLGYQACQGAVCYPPKKAPFTIALPPAK